MYEFKIRLANKTVAVSAFYENTMRYCEEYLTDLADVDVYVRVEKKDFVREFKKTVNENGAEEGLPTGESLESTIVLRKIAEAFVSYGIILFHSSAIALDGEAYLFTAKSGTGKSTHTSLWRDAFGDRAVMINDDKPFLEITDSAITVWGNPWNGKHCIGNNISAPLHAICILERAENNRIEKQMATDAFPHIYGQTYRFDNAEKMKKTLDLVDVLVKRVGLYKLGCNMEPEAARVSYNGMKG